METQISRRGALALGVGTAASATTVAWAQASPVADPTADLIPPHAAALRHFASELAHAPRRRDFKTVPMFLTDRSQWDAEALDLLLAYRGTPKQVWDQTELDSPWLNLMRNALNTQIWSFGHPDFLVASATHGSAHFALFNQTMWDKYRLGAMTNGKMASNTLIEDQPTPKSAAYDDPKGPYAAAANSIPTLMRRGVVFLGCHNAIWEIAGRLIRSGINPDRLVQDDIAAELTNHLIPGVVLSPGAVATIPELQRAGFFYIK